MIYRMCRKWIAFSVIVTALLSLVSCSFSVPEICMFYEIEECYDIVGELDESCIFFYEDPSEDADSEGLEYVAFFGLAYDADDCAFRLFAYEFIDEDTAKRYYSNVTGKDTNSDTVFSDKSGMGRFRRIVVSGNRAYSVYTSNNDFEKVNIILGKIFKYKWDCRKIPKTGDGSVI